MECSPSYDYTLRFVSHAYKITGMERDGESGNDHTQFRQYASNFGRWLSPDPAGVKVVNLAEPQTWNMYSYVLDLPTVLTDPTGLSPEVVERQENNDSPEGSAAEKDQQQDDAIKMKAQEQPTSAGKTRTPAKGPPDTTVHYPGEKPGTGTDRTYGPDGRAVQDIDRGHDHGAGDPHAHEWDWSGAKPQRGPAQPLPAEEKGSTTKMSEAAQTAVKVTVWATAAAIGIRMLVILAGVAAF